MRQTDFRVGDCDRACHQGSSPICPWTQALITLIFFSPSDYSGSGGRSGGNSYGSSGSSYNTGSHGGYGGGSGGSSSYQGKQGGPGEQVARREVGRSFRGTELDRSRATVRGAIWQLLLVSLGGWTWALATPTAQSSQRPQVAQLLNVGTNLKSHLCQRD